MQDLEYLLKFTLDSTTLKVEQVHDVSNSLSVTAFKKKFADVKTIKGFTKSIGKTTFFPIFNVPLSKGTTHTVTYCEVAVGESVYVSKEYAKSLNPPDYFDSFVVNEARDQTEVLENINIGEYSYVIKDESRILPLYEVVFEYDEELEKKSKGAFICERCKSKQSISFCPSERANFCEECDEAVHIDEFHKRHDRYYFNQVGKRRFIYCRIHPTTMVDYFCDECMIPVCSKCKINGNHSEPPCSSHPLMKYLDACDKLQEAVRENNSELKSLRDQLGINAGNFKERVVNFKDKISETRNKIENEYKSLMNALRLFESDQTRIINAQFIDIERRNSFLERLQAYPESLEPSQLVRSFKSVMVQFDEADVSVRVEHKPKEIELKGKMSLGDPLILVPRQGYSPRMDKSTKLYVDTRGTKNTVYDTNYY